jgi:hypothetical protein
MELKAKDCAGLPGDLVSFEAKDSTGELQKYDGAKIIRTLYETKDPVTNQSIFTDHAEIERKNMSGNWNWGLYKPVLEPPESALAASASYPSFLSSRRLPTIHEAQTPESSPPPSGRFGNVSSVANLMSKLTVKKNPLSSVPGKGGKSRRKRSKRRKTHRR